MQTLATLIRHGITYLVGLLVAWFTLHLTTPDDLKTATDAANALVEPLVVVAGFAAVILSRLVLAWAGKLFITGSGEKSGGSPGVVNLLWLGVGLCGTAAVGILPSCSPDYPLTGSVSYRDAASGSKAGLDFSPGQAPRGSIRVPLRDTTTGEIIGQVNLHSGK